MDKNEENVIVETDHIVIRTSDLEAMLMDTANLNMIIKLVNSDLGDTAVMDVLRSMFKEKEKK